MTTYNGNYFNHAGQTAWNLSRLNKLARILGPGWFEGKSVLEVGSGHGMNGRALIVAGANVTFTDGRALHVDFLKSLGLNAHVMDQDKDWAIDGVFDRRFSPNHMVWFDLVVHWGVLYHLENWRQDLKCALEHTSLMCLETEIVDSDDPLCERKVAEIDNYDQALNRTGMIMSAQCLENYLTSLGATFTRYDDEDVDSKPWGDYSWKSKNDGGFHQGQRRFWMVTR